MAGDFPQNFQKFPDAFQFIKDVPVDWDDTKVISAEPGEFVVTARKKKSSEDWFLGGITDENSRKIEVKLDFLKENVEYEATIYKDGPKASWDKNPRDYVIEKLKLNSKSSLNLQMATGGGFAVSFRRI